MKDNDTDLTYSCTVGSRGNNQTARLVPQEDSVVAQGIGIVVGVILVTVLMGLMPYCAERFQKLCKSKRCLEKISASESGSEMEPMGNQGNMDV